MKGMQSEMAKNPVRGRSKGQFRAWLTSLTLPPALPFQAAPVYAAIKEKNHG